MSNKVEMIGISLSALATTFTNQMVEKIILASVGAIVYVTVAVLYKKWLEARGKDDECKNCFKDEDNDRKI